MILATACPAHGALSRLILMVILVAGSAGTLAMAAPPVITQQPTNLSGCPGSDVKFIVMATDATSYQWRKGAIPLTNGGSVSGATTATLVISPVATGDAGRYDVLVSNADGQMTSTAASLTILSGVLPGDLDCDGNVDLDDLYVFIGCHSGPNTLRSDGCGGADFDYDGDVDQSDYGAFQAAYGSGPPPQAYNATKITLTLEMGGDNHVADWKAGTRSSYSRGSAADGQECSIYGGALVNYAVVVKVEGLHAMLEHPSDLFETFGAANLVFNLELHQGTDMGPLATSAVFKSTINDGTGTDPIAAAAFAVSYQIGGAKGRLIDTVTNGGPRMEPVFTYPCFAPGSGKLIGFGAGYKEWNRTGNNDVITLAGVGMTQMPNGSGGHVPGLGEVPIAEGQIDMSTLPLGTYTLKVVPGNGSTVLRGDLNMLTSVNRPAFAIPVGQTAGDTITFVTNNNPPCNGIVARRIFYNNSAWDGYTPGITTQDFDAIAPDKQPLLPGQRATSANYISYSKSINGIIVDACHFNRAPTVDWDIYFLMGNAYTDPFSWTDVPPAPNDIQVFPGAGVGGSDRLVITWADNAIPNTKWLLVALFAGDWSLGLPADDYFMFGIAKGECSGDGLVNTTDEAGCRTHRCTPFNPAPISSLYDINRDKLVNPTDEIIVRQNRTLPYTQLKLITW
jgi:hypothetical protein